MARKPKKPVRKKAPNPVARADIALNRKAGPLPSKKGKGTPYDRARGKSLDPDGGDGGGE